MFARHKEGTKVEVIKNDSGLSVKLVKEEVITLKDKEPVNRRTLLLTEKVVFEEEVNE
jgi:hypothetical protein